MDVVALLDNYGLPIAMIAVFIGFTIKMYNDNNEQNSRREEKMYQQNQEREDKLYKTIDDVNSINKEISETNKGLTETNKKLTETNKELVQQFKTEVLIIKNDIEDIKHAVLKN